MGPGVSKRLKGIFTVFLQASGTDETKGGYTLPVRSLFRIAHEINHPPLEVTTRIV
jgi:hypothetical protein